MRFRTAAVLASALRIALIIYADFHDAHSSLKYTDVDYAVFSDAAAFLLHPKSGEGAIAIGPLARRLGLNLGSPYQRATYRYTPLLGLMMLPNHLWFQAWGKALFSLADIAVGCLLYHTLRRRGTPESRATAWISTVWLLNPMVANISTRGSSEAVLGVLVVGFVAAAETGRWDAAAVTLGLATHFKIYPFLYGASVWARLARGGRWFSVNASQARFAGIAVFALHAVTSAMYSLWGFPFLEHSYLHHINRRDHRHNFSPYFYPIYLTYPQSDLSIASQPPSAFVTAIRHPLASFLPQFGVSLGLGFLFGGEDLPFACLLQTIAFVAFNKVATSQYFMWYLWLLPLVLPRLPLGVRQGVAIGAVWVTAQVVWLSQAYRLELKGEPVFVEVWASSIAFLVANTWIVGRLIDAHSSSASPAYAGADDAPKSQ